MTLRTWLKGATAACAVVFASQTAFAVDNAGALRGVVTDAGGKPVAGAFVKLRNADRHLTFMVISKNAGVYQANDLPPGQYTAEGVGAGFESKISAPVTVATGKIAAANISLTAKQGPMLPPAWPDKLQEKDAPKASTYTLPQGAGKELVEAKCISCHNVMRIVTDRTDKENWQHFVDQMRDNMLSAKLPDLTESEATTIVDYLATNFPRVVAYNSNNRLPRTLLEGEARNYRVVTFEMQPDYSEPHDITVDPAGIAWAAKRGGAVSVGGILVRFDPHSLAVEEVNGPPGTAGKSRRRLGNPQVNEQGILWTADAPNGRWLSFDTKTRKFVAYYAPKDHFAGGNSMALNRQDGTIWSSDEKNGVYSLNPKTGAWTFYTAPTPNSGAYGIAIAGDGSVWFAEDRLGRMGRVDPKTGKVEDFPIPYEGPGPSTPRRMNTDGDGNIWVGLWSAGKLMKIDYKTKKMTIYSPPTKEAGDYSVTVDKKRNIVWVSEQEVDKIARFDPSTNSWMEFSLPDSQSDPRRIEIDPTDSNRVFFSGNASNLIGFVEYMPDGK